jgi:hypothetical protein
VEKEEEEEEDDIVIEEEEEEECRVKTYQDAVKSLKELQEFAIQLNDADMLSVIFKLKCLRKVRQPSESTVCKEAGFTVHLYKILHVF